MKEMNKNILSWEAKEIKMRLHYCIRSALRFANLSFNQPLCPPIRKTQWLATGSSIFRSLISWIFHQHFHNSNSNFKFFALLILIIPFKPVPHTCLVFLHKQHRSSPSSSWTPPTSSSCSFLLLSSALGTGSIGMTTKKLYSDHVITTLTIISL